MAMNWIAARPPGVRFRAMQSMKVGQYSRPSASTISTLTIASKVPAVSR